MSPPLPLPPFFPFPLISSFVSSSFSFHFFPSSLSFLSSFFLSLFLSPLHLSLLLFNLLSSSFLLSFFLLLSFCPYYTSFRPFLLHFCLNFPPHSFPIARLPLPILFSSIYSSTSCLPSSSLFPCPRSPSICPTTPSSSSFSFSLTPCSRTLLFPSFFHLFSHSFPF